MSKQHCSTDWEPATRDRGDTERVLNRAKRPISPGSFAITVAAASLLLLGGCGIKDESADAQEALVRTSPDLTSAPALIRQLQAGEITSEAVVSFYLERIASIDRSGPSIQSIISINPKASIDAKASDARRQQGLSLGPLDGVPILVKDNIETADMMPTTAGSLALKDNLAAQDSPVVARLREGGAIVLGKTNLSQWANFRSNSSISGWSSLGGQVKNPHVLDRSPCGSSSGSAAAVAASLAPLAIGTETNGSIICPANVNGVVGFKPTLGLLPQTGIVPIAPSQDTAGPLAKTVAGAALMLAVMAGDADGFKLAEPTSTTNLRGVTIGALRFAQGNHPQILALFENALSIFARAGATIVDIESFSPTDENLGEHELKVLQVEFKASLNDYLAKTHPAVTTRTLDELIVFNEQHKQYELPLFGQDLFHASAAQPGLDDHNYLTALDAIKKASGENGIDKLLADSGADFLVSPSGPLSPPRDAINGDIWPAWVGIGYLAAIAGYPHLSIPMGHVNHIPVGLSILGPAYSDGRILAIGEQWQKEFGPAPTPTFLESVNQAPAVTQANLPLSVLSFPNPNHD